jgi:hypothetical protein
MSIMQQMRRLHTQLQLLSVENSTCPDSERYPFLKELIALDKRYHANWEQYDHFKVGAPLPEATAEHVEEHPADNTPKKADEAPADETPKQEPTPATEPEAKPADATPVKKAAKKTAAKPKTKSTSKKKTA